MLAKTNLCIADRPSISQKYIAQSARTGLYRRGGRMCATKNEIRASLFCADPFTKQNK